jgi:hypothetical protein
MMAYHALYLLGACKRTLIVYKTASYVVGDWLMVAVVGSNAQGTWTGRLWLHLALASAGSLPLAGKAAVRRGRQEDGVDAGPRPLIGKRPRQGGRWRVWGVV